MADLVYNDPEVVKNYVEFRPVPPEKLITTVVDFVKEKRVSSFVLDYILEFLKKLHIYMEAMENYLVQVAQNSRVNQLCKENFM